MVSVNLCFVGIVLYAFAVKSCDSFQCFECSLTEACKDEFDTSQTNLLSTETACVQCYKTKTDDGDVVRGCLTSAQYENKCEDVDGGKVCACDTDQCNGASTLSTSTTTAFFLSVLALSVTCLF